MKETDFFFEEGVLRYKGEIKTQLFLGKDLNINSETQRHLGEFIGICIEDSHRLENRSTLSYQINNTAHDIDLTVDLHGALNY